MNKKGFTMIEVIVSSMIIALLAAGVFGAFLGAKSFLNHARYRVQAFNFAMEALDRLRSNYSYKSSPQLDIDPADTWKSESNGLKDMDMLNATLTADMGVNTTLTYRVDDAAGAAADGYKDVTIKVIWDE
jgi:prepilin-type N-terminal cleavage/methylation domain